jgi:hypothetical protein
MYFSMYIREPLPSSIISIEQAASTPAGNDVVELMCCNYTLLCDLKQYGN